MPQNFAKLHKPILPSFKHGWKSADPIEQILWQHVLKGSSWTLTKQKSWSFSAGVTLRFPLSRTTAHLWNLSLNSNTLESLLLVMETCTQLLRRVQTTSGLLLPEFTDLVTAIIFNTAVAFPGLCFDSWYERLSSMDYGRIMGHYFSDIWFLKNKPHTYPSSWLPGKTPGCQEKYWYLLRAPRNRSDARFSYWFRCIIQFWNSLLTSNNP